MPAVTLTFPKFAPLSDDVLRDLEARFGRIHEHTPAAPPRSRWAVAGSPDPAPPYQVVFRPCLPGEWDNIMGQANDERQKAGSPKNLAKSTVIAVNFEGEPVIHQGEPHDRAAAKPVREAFDRLLRTWAGVPQAVADGLAELNGVMRTEAEK